MIRALFDDVTVTAAPGTPGSRTLQGVAVPWGVVGRVSNGELVAFEPGSLDPAARPVLLRDHDSSRPIGRVIDARDDGTSMVATARVAATRDGDEALVLASAPDQVLGALSVGADPIRFTYDNAGVMRVQQATWHELSLLPFGAYAAARVLTVTAQQGEPMNPTLSPTDPDPDVPVDPDEPDTPIEPEERLPGIVQASALRPAVVPLRAGAGGPPQLTLAGVASIISAGMRSNRRAGQIQAQIQAAWTNVTSTNVTGIVPPAYRAEVVGLIDHGMPLVRALDSRPMPASGMAIEYPRWLALPDSTAVQATEKTLIGSGDVTIELKSDAIKTWAQGNDISFQAMDRSSPSFIDAYLRAAAMDAGRKFDTSVGTDLLAIATAGTLPTTVTFVNCVAALFAALNPATTPPGPLFLAVSYDVSLGMIPVTANNGPAFWSGSIALGDMLPNENAGGLAIFTDWNLPIKTMLLGSRMGAAVYGGPDTTADIRAVDVSLLGIDLGVYFYAALAIEYPGAFAKLTGVTLPLGDEPATTAKSK